MQTKTINRLIPAGGQTLNIDLYGGTLTNNGTSGFITVEGQPVAAGATISLTPGDASVSILATVPTTVTVVYTSNEEKASSLGSVSINEPVQIGANAPELGLIRLLSSAARTYGITYKDINGEQVGLSYDLAVNAPGGQAVGLPSLPAGAVTAAIVPMLGVSDSAVLYYAVTSDSAKIADFQANYGRYKRLLVTQYGAEMGA
jgi:hypothetical protein